jgi:hypothetical protein
MILRKYIDIIEANYPSGPQKKKPVEPLNKAGEIAVDVVKDLAPTAAAGAATKQAILKAAPKYADKVAAAKAGQKVFAPIPGAMTALSVKDAYERWQEGDRTGSVISVLAAAGYLIPGPMGWVLGGIPDALNLGRDIGRGDYDALGQAVKDYVTKEENDMNPIEQIAALREKLAGIEEGPVSAGFKQGAKHSNKVAATGAQDARVVKDMGPAVQVSRPALPAAPTAPTVPAAVNTTNNAGKIAVGGAAAAGAAGLAGYLSTKDKPGQSSNPPAQGSSNAAKPPPGITPPTSSSLTADEEQELALLANELGKEMGRLPDLDNLLLRHQKLRGEMPQP